MRHNRVSKLAARRTAYTGETYDQARSALAPEQPPIPAPASRDQLHFEADVFHQVVESHRDFTQYTFGIRRVRPALDSLELEAESEDRGDRLLRFLLPVHEPEGEVHGLVGLRIRQRTAQGIELHQSGRKTSVWLTGLPAATWRRIETSVLEHTADLGWRALWRGPDDWTEEELLFEQQWNGDEYTRNFHAGAWCTSGLLRRLGIFHTAVAADFVTAYKGLGINGYDGFGPVRWCIDLIHRTGARYLNDGLVTALTDADFGLPVAPARHLDHIYGDLTPGVVRLDDAARTGLIELRFSAFDYNLTEPKYGEMAARIRERVDAVLASAA
ncbi:hypothetical protein ACWD4B_11985 [Streptomyces sp. NPDC002536]